MFTVLGASGNIGSKVADALLKRGEQVRVVARNPQKLEVFKKQGADLYLGQIGDSAFLTKCFKDCVAAFVMIPPDYRSRSLGMHYQKMSESIRDAIRNSGIRYVVNLSSFGAEHASGTGPIQFLHAHEDRLNRLESCNLMHLRPAFFMENLMSFVPGIRQGHKVMTSLKADLPIPMVASLDVARVATEHLLSREFEEKNVRCVLGPRDVSMMEICLFLSRVLEQRINYQQLSEQECQRSFIQNGVSDDVARLFVEMYRAFNSGLINTISARNETNTTTTKVEDFLRAFRGIFHEDSDLGKQTDTYQEESPPQH
ncbi:NmrA family NAD(P)-binding protein [Bdellovibrio sp. HCB337]|uniref:NmrA family NAD(P)-binding protein n=1 Tax=Bdellovibrio sp. HCB337 TaxID=3394358 RepID=UPI0039A5FFF3